MGKKKRLAFGGALILAIIVIVGVICFTEYSAKQKREIAQDVQREEELKEQEEQESEEIDTTPDELIFFEEENLFFLSASMQEKVKQGVMDVVKSRVSQGVTCCVFLSNIEDLSMRTYRLYVQTNADTKNLIQIIVNDSQDFLELEFTEKEIKNIEAYGGVKEGDNIERIYIYGSYEGDRNIEVDVPTLEEEQAGKEEDYKKGR